jgi:hypothetical protein
MNEQDVPVARIASQRVAQVFGLAVDEVNLASRFGIELPASSVSDFKENELDQILGDIQEIRDIMPRGDLPAGEVRTVGDFVALLEEFQRTNPRAYQVLMKRWPKEQGMAQRPQWRQAIFRITGL